MIRTILVEDDRALAGNIIDYLELENITCDHASDGVFALNLLQHNEYDVVILDINLPRLNGLKVCETLRQAGVTTSIIMLTAQGQLEDKLAGFAAGSDDYLVKPFAMAELVARVQALSTRKSGQVRQLKQYNLTLHLDTKIVTIKDVSLKLAPTAFSILEALMRAYPSPISRTALLGKIWGDEQPDSNSLKVHIHHIRKKLRDNSRITIKSDGKQGFLLCFSEENNKCEK
ncbi:response regulator transcription factor [Pseudoalteromonas piscicida]|uniref:Two-component system response regulator n=1 Tax=Pseudoalteromonas piscicida TaxID=43662 RepID=A0A2A5JKN6_PSEO7|nr:response regulator transcription factor [Pseudoalteromonas piscicida]PCK29899.1 two-component system response regulator [Pseudoalteromonas piscicida]